MSGRVGPLYNPEDLRMDADTARRLFDQLDHEQIVASLTGFEWDVARARRTQARLAEAGLFSRTDLDIRERIAA